MQKLRSHQAGPREPFGGWALATVRRGVLLAAVLVMIPAAASGQEKSVFRETFGGAQLPANRWDAQPKAPRVNYLGGGYLMLASPAASVYSTEKFEAKPGRALVVGYCAGPNRGGADNGENPTFQLATDFRSERRFTGGMGWVIGQQQGPARLTSTAQPYDANGVFGPAQANYNIDTLFMTVLRPIGAYHLMYEPGTATATARLCFVTTTPRAGEAHVALLGGKGQARYSSVDVVDLPNGRWGDQYGLATVLDTFKDASLVRPEKGPGKWAARGSWAVNENKLTGGGMLLTDAGTADQYVEVRVLPGRETKTVGLLLRARDMKNHLRFEVTPEGSRLVQVVAGKETVVPGSADPRVKLAEAGASPRRLAARLEGNTATLLINGQVAQLVPVSEQAVEAFKSGGNLVGLVADADTTFEEFVTWPCRVPIPKTLVDRLPAVPLAADGEVLVQDDFSGPAGPLNGRKPTLGKGAWSVVAGDWVTDAGVCRVRAADGGPAVREAAEAVIDCGAADVEITATFALPRETKEKFPYPADHWLPGFTIRGEGARPTGRINPRISWQKDHADLEVWDLPADTPDNRAKWKETEPGPQNGKLVPVAVGGSSLNGGVKPGELHVLKVIVRGNRVSVFRDEVLVATCPTRVGDQGTTWVGLSLGEKGNTGCQWMDFKVRGFKPTK